MAEWSAHLTIANDVRTLLLDSQLGEEFWADAAVYAVYTRNRIPGKNQKESPEAIWYGRPPRLDHLQPFGAEAFYRNYKAKSKLQPRYRKARLLGYQPGTTYYRLLDIITGKTVESRDVKFSKPDMKPPQPAKNVPHLKQAAEKQCEVESGGEEDVGEEEDEVPLAQVPRPVTPPAEDIPANDEPVQQYPGWARASEWLSIARTRHPHHGIVAAPGVFK
jgi:hypothetical protein